MSLLRRKISLTMFKKSSSVEDDALASRPRVEENIDDSLSDSSDDAADSEEESRAGAKKGHKTSDEEKDAEFVKSGANQTTSGGNSFSQNTNIHISHSTGIQIGHQFHINMNRNPSQGKMPQHDDEESQNQFSEPPKPPEKIEQTFSNREAAQTTDFIAIKYDIRSNSKKLAQNLELSETTFQEIYRKYKDRGNSEIFYQLMLKWKESQPRTTTLVGILCEALWKSNETSAATILSKLHPTT